MYTCSCCTAQVKPSYAFHGFKLHQGRQLVQLTPTFGVCRHCFEPMIVEAFTTHVDTGAAIAELTALYRDTLIRLRIADGILDESLANRLCEVINEPLVQQVWFKVPFLHMTRERSAMTTFLWRHLNASG